MGGDVKYAISGGAPLGARLGHFFRGIGLIVLEGYGLTETAAAAVIGRVSWQKIGKVGRALPGTGIKIADDGEVFDSASSVPVVSGSTFPSAMSSARRFISAFASGRHSGSTKLSIAKNDGRV